MTGLRGALLVASVTCACASPSVAHRGAPASVVRIPRETTASSGRPEPAAEHTLEREDPTLRLLELQGAADPLPPVSEAALRATVPDGAGADMDAHPGMLEGRALNRAGAIVGIRFQWGAVESVLLTADARGKVLDSVSFAERTRVFVADVLGDETLELVVVVTEGSSLSSYPESWHLYRVDEGGKLWPVAELASSYAHGSKEMRTFFSNEITMPRKGLLRVETVRFTEQGPAPPVGAPRSLGEVYELRYDEDAKRFRRVERRVGD